MIYGVGDRLRTVQTGYLRSYVLFLVLAAVGIFVVLSYFVAMATARLRHRPCRRSPRRLRCEMTLP